MDVEYGTVRFFMETKGYGFLDTTTPNGERLEESVFFHYQDGQLVGRVGASPCFMGSKVSLYGQFIRLCVPEEGDRLVFLRDASKNGKPKAHPWGYADAWDAAGDLTCELSRSVNDWEDGDPRLILDSLR